MFNNIYECFLTVELNHPQTNQYHILHNNDCINCMVNFTTSLLFMYSVDFIGYLIKRSKRDDSNHHAPVKYVLDCTIA